LPIDFPALAAAALEHIETLLEQWLPGGEVRGHDYVVRNPTRADSNMGSFSVSLLDGRWLDFATEDKGGDLISLYAYLNQSASQREAAHIVAEAIGESVDDVSTPMQYVSSAQERQSPATDWQTVMPVPGDAPPMMADRYWTTPLFSPKKESSNPLRPTIIWPYKNENGELLGYVIRLPSGNDGKITLPVTYCRHRQTGDQRWCLQAFPDPRPLFGLAWLAQYLDAVVLVCEGEKAAMAANRLIGSKTLIAITSPGGCKAVHKADWSALAGRRVVLWPDADAAGTTYAIQVAKLAKAADAQDLRVIDRHKLEQLLDVKELPKGHDAADIDGDRINKTKLIQLIEQAVSAEALSDTKRWLDPHDPMTTAEQLLHEQWQHAGQRTLHRFQDGWWAWTGTHYAELTQAHMRAVVYAFCKTAWTENQQGGIEPFKPNAYKVSNILDALAALTQLNAEFAPCWLNHESQVLAADQQPHEPHDIIAFHNGLLSISDWIAHPDEPLTALQPHTPAWFSPQVLPHDFDPEAECPIWEQFIDRCAQGDQSWIVGLAMWFGYNLTADTSLQKMAMLVGAPRAGKGITARVLRAILGEENVVAPKVSSLSERFGLWPFIGKLAAIAYDVRIGRSTDPIAVVETILAISGEDPQTIDRKNVSALTMKLATRLTFVGNELLNLPDPSGALSARLLVFPFLVSHRGNEDETLEGRIMAELPGIANWALIGLRALRQRGKLLEPASGADQKEEFEHLASPMKSWLEDRVEVGPGLGLTPVATLYDDWQLWCDNEGRAPGSKATFGTKLRAVLPGIKRVRRGSSGDRYWAYQDIRLNPANRSLSPTGDLWGQS
jgi:putative DNA primase/helicase